MEKPAQKIVNLEYRDSVALIILNRSTTNALNLELVNLLADSLERLKQDENARSVVVTSSNEKFFSIGFDIPQLFALSRDNFAVFYKAFNRLCLKLCTFPKPTIAAITGHAVAGGCIIALCCDYRFIAQGKKKMGLNEIKLGVPIPYPAHLVLQQVVADQYAREIVDTGEFYLPDKLKEMGMVDAVLPLEQVQTMAIEKAKSLGGSLPKAYAMIKRNRTELVAERILSKLEEKEEIFIDLWYSKEVRKNLEQAMEKF